MTFIVITMLACLVAAGAVLAYTAFPHRGESTGSPWLDQAFDRAAGSVPPTFAEGDLDDLHAPDYDDTGELPVA